MNSEEILAWTKQNKKALVSEILSSANLTPSEHPIAIFMAGLPGAGKTELTHGFIKSFKHNFMRIDMDELATMIPSYQPENADKFRQPATILLDELFSKTIKSRLDFIMDGTFGSSRALGNIERVIKRGYTVKIAYAFQDPKLAWQFTLAREKVEHRSIQQSGFIETYYKTINNLHALLTLNLPNVSVDIFYKNPDNTVGEQHQNIQESEIDNLIHFIYNKDKLKEYINA